MKEACIRPYLVLPMISGVPGSNPSVLLCFGVGGGGGVGRVASGGYLTLFSTFNMICTDNFHAPVLDASFQFLFHLKYDM